MSRTPGPTTDSPLNDYDLGQVLISGIEPPLAEDTEFDGALGARHVEHNLEVLLLRFPNNAVDTEIYLIWNNSDAPVDYLIVQPENLNNTFFSLRVDKHQILPESAEVYCLIKRPSGNTSNTKPLKLRVRVTWAAALDPNEEADGNQGFVFFLPPDLEAGSHIDEARAERGVVLEVHPWENQAPLDTCQIAWGSEYVKHVVTPDEVRRSFNMFISPDVIKANPQYQNMPVAMQVWDVAGNYAADPNSKSNWSEIQRVDVNFGLLRPEEPFLEQAGETVDLEKLGDAAQKIEIFVDNNFFERGDRIHFHWEGRDIQNVPFFYSDQKNVVNTNVIEEFFVPNEIVRAVASGIVIMYYELYKHRDDVYLPSRKVRIRIVGNVIEWPEPSILEAPNGELSPNSTATIKFRAQAGWTSATKIRIVMAGHSVNYTYEFFLGPIPENREFSHVVPAGEVARFNTLAVDVYYERIDLEPHRQSQRLPLIVGRYARTLPPVEVDSRWGNYLIPDNIGTHLKVTMPIADSLVRDIVRLDWEGSNTSTSIFIEVSAEQAGNPLEALIERQLISDNLDGSVRVKYSLARANAPRRFSPISVFYVRAGSDHLTNFHNGNLNGWAYGPALNDLRDREFRIYGNYTVFHNYTYTSRNIGVIFSQTFKNLQPGQRYEFSIQVRRFDGRYVEPMLSLSSSQGQLTTAIVISDLVNFQTLTGVETTSSTELVFYINSHVQSGNGNDYEIGEIRVRLI